jgi:hypothetical protein
MHRLGPTAMASKLHEGTGGHRVPEGDPLTNIRRGELKRIFRHCGVPEIDILNRVEDILAERRRWSADALGRRINLTFQDKLLLGIRTIQCVDRTPAEVKAHFRERKRERDRIRKKKLREMRRPDDDISVRARELLGALGWEWIRSTDLAEKLKKRKPFRRVNGRRLKNGALRQAVHRASRELCEVGLAEEKLEVGLHHERVRFVRKRRWGDAILSQRLVSP